ncbi:MULTISPECIES: hypothetical protein [Serratia]|uniref:hypothetical protein n=1 Tax=Serratia TaxID=613 RepID=UPI000B414ADF|nr:hypothetical protein [Serratia marcescens]MDU6303030.1 hypothetical protein [Serratia marcescens]
MLEIESLAALDGVNDKMHDMRSTPRGENSITGRRSEIFCASIMVLLSNTNTRQQKTVGKTRRLMAG